VDRSSDRGRIVAAALSAVLPGLGQLANRDTRLAMIFAAPVLLLAALAWLLLQLSSPARLAATRVGPPFLTILLVLNGAFLLWRLAAVGQAFLDARFGARPTGRGWIGLALVMAFVAIPHGLGNAVGSAAQSTFDRVFQGEVGAATAPPGPGSTERLNVLIVGMDVKPGRTAVLTDTLMVVSLDPVGKTVTMLSIPRDTVNVPLANGDTYGPKLNSLYGYAERHPDEFPEGGFETLEGAVATLLGIDIHYRVEAEMAGLIRVVDAVGGIDVVVDHDIRDPRYDGWGLPERGWSIEAGRHHLDGVNALAYARVRYATGESDFTRAQRQQEVPVAIRDAAMRGENLLFRLPALLDAVGDTVRTNLPSSRLPALAAVAGEIGPKQIARVVIRAPLVRPGSNRYGSVQIPDIAAIRQVAAAAFGEPGVPPQPWPTQKPKPTPKPTKAPATP
jgi:LCP family protein required for cell wall assembly